MRQGYITGTGSPEVSDEVQKFLECLEYDMARYDNSNETIDSACQEYASEATPVYYSDIFSGAQILAEYAQQALDEGLVETNKAEGLIERAFQAGWEVLYAEKVRDNETLLLQNILLKSFAKLPENDRTKIDDVSEQTGIPSQKIALFIADKIIKENSEHIDEMVIGDMLQSFKEQLGTWDEDKINSLKESDIQEIPDSYNTWTGDKGSTEKVKELFECMEIDMPGYDKSNLTISEAFQEYVSEFCPIYYTDIFQGALTLADYAQQALDEGLVDIKDTKNLVEISFQLGWDILFMEKIEDNKETVLNNILVRRLEMMSEEKHAEIEQIASEQNMHVSDFVQKYIQDTIDEGPEYIADLLMNFEEKIDQAVNKELAKTEGIEV